MDIRIQHFKNSLATFKTNDFFSPRVRRSWATFDKYYLKTEDSPYCAAAIIIHPSWRTGYLKHNWEQKGVRPAIQADKVQWDHFKNQDFVPSLVPSFEEATEDPDNDYDISARNLANFPRPHSKDDFEEYTSELAIHIIYQYTIYQYTIYPYFGNEDLWFELLLRGRLSGPQWFRGLTGNTLFTEAIRLLCDYGLVEADPLYLFPSKTSHGSHGSRGSIATASNSFYPAARQS